MRNPATINEKKRLQTNKRQKKHRDKIRELNKSGKNKNTPASKKCPGCENTLSANKFSKDVTKLDGLQTKCKICISDSHKNYDDINPLVQKKICDGKGGCGKKKTLSEFTKQKQGKFGYSNLCRVCRAKKKEENMQN